MIDEWEAKVLGLMDADLIGGPHPVHDFTPPAKEAFDRLRERGLVEQVWQISQAGKDALKANITSSTTEAK